MTKETTKQPKTALFAGYNPPHGAVCVDVKDIAKNMTTIKPPNSTELRERHRTPQEAKRISNIEPEMGEKNQETVGQHLQESLCRESEPEQPNQNLMTFEQIEGCCDIIEKLLNELIPKTEQVEGCITTHKSWRGNNLKHLRKAFE